jgi:hypothetical protein
LKIHKCHPHESLWISFSLLNTRSYLHRNKTCCHAEGVPRKGKNDKGYQPYEEEPLANNIGYKMSVPSPKGTQYLTITGIKWLMLFKETIAVYAEIRNKHINTLCGQNAK